MNSPHDAPPPTAGVVIVSHNSALLLVDRVGQWSNRDNAELVVVDNASTDGSASLARAAGALTIEMGTNAGYAIACNRGADALRSRHEWIAFVNPDVDLHPDDLARLIADAPSDAVALSPLLVDNVGRPLPDIARPEPRLASTLAVWLLTARADRPAKRMLARIAETPGRWFEVPVTSGACLVVRSSAIKDDGFSESYFLFSEDIDISISLRSKGRLLVDRDIRVRHTSRSSSSGVGRTARQLEAGRAVIVFFARRKPRWQLPVVSAAIVAGMAVRGLREPMRCPVSAAAWRGWATGTALLGREALRIARTVWRGAALPRTSGPLFVGRQLG